MLTVVQHGSRRPHRRHYLVLQRELRFRDAAAAAAAAGITLTLCSAAETRKLEVAPTTLATFFLI